jgi:DtxR family Mn-dependent transcriptional regulator
VNDSQRIETEDALKHLHRCEQARQAATVESLAGALSMDLTRAGQLLGRLQSAGLADLVTGHFRLTDNGRSYALQVIRAHRLYETYLAEENGRKETAWHREADIHEHRLTEHQVNELAQRLGHPRFDPHGDPIPTAAGEVHARHGKALTDWPAGEPARIVHIEDEPDAVYAQLVAQGLCAGMDVRVIESNPQRVVLLANGEQHVLAPIVAANISVAAVPALHPLPDQMEPLSRLRNGERARVVSLSPRCRGPERRRLLDLGIVPNTTIEAVMTSPSGDPTAYRVRQTLVALRREQADLISVVRLQAEVAA